jgi:hypothetical protein
MEETKEKTWKKAQKRGKEKKGKHKGLINPS